MKNFLRCSGLLILIFSVSVSNAQQIISFDDLMNGLKSGKQVNSVIHYVKFKLISDNQEQEKIPDAIGGMDMSTWEFFAENSVKNKEAFVVFSESKLIQNPKGDGYVYNYVKVRIDKSGKVKISARYLDAITYEVKMDENFFGAMNDGKNDAGLFLYIK